MQRDWRGKTLSVSGHRVLERYCPGVIKRKLSLWFAGGLFCSLYQVKQMNYFILHLSGCSLQPLVWAAPQGEGAERERGRREQDLEFIAGDLLCVRHLEWSAPQICNTTIGQRNDVPFYRWGDQTSVQFDSASSSQLPSGMVQLWDWNPGLFDQRWGISWLNPPSLHSFFILFLLSFLPSTFLLSSFCCLETNSDTS